MSDLLGPDGKVPAVTRRRAGFVAGLLPVGIPGVILALYPDILPPIAAGAMLPFVWMVAWWYGGSFVEIAHRAKPSRDKS